VNDQTANPKNSFLRYRATVSIAVMTALCASWTVSAQAPSPSAQPSPSSLASPAAPSAPSSGPRPPSYTSAQAEQGKATYAQSCARCHGANLDDGEFGPPLHGSPFIGHWAARPVADLFNLTRMTMPPDRAGSLGDQTYAQVIAFLLQENGVTASSTELPSDVQTLAAMVIPGDREAGPAGPGGGLAPGVVLPPWPALPNPLAKLTPVTDEMLVNPPAGDWLIWRRTADDMGFSPLAQINKGNVKSLRLAWSVALPPGLDEATPLVHDGVIFISSHGDNIEALDAAAGNQLWQYSRQLPQGAPATLQRSISLYGDKVYSVTSDNSVVALSAKTGKMVWQQQIADAKSGSRLTGGPLVVKGRVMQGTVGRQAGGQSIVGLDAETGKVSWHINTIPQPGDPNEKTWNDTPLEKRNGGSVWTAGSYDSDLKLAFFGTGQTYDTLPLLRPSKKRGISNDGLYLDSTLAIDPDTGRVAWYFQHLPDDQWDFDWVFEQQILDLPVNGQSRKLIVTAGKEAVYDAVDAKTGKYAFSFDLGVQNLITSIDPKTGAKKVDSARVPGSGKTVSVCPHAGGAKNWIPGSYNPTTKILYVPVNESCMDLIPVGPGERGALSTGVRWAIKPGMNSDGKVGRLQAINLETRKPVWTERQRAAQTSGVLATAGGLVFAGAVDRWFKAYDDATGKTLWKVQLSAVPNSVPITYQVGDKQYIAVIVSDAGLIASTFLPLSPEIAAQRASTGASIFVFELASD
jgi:alcohol dehydrogenase (cytochrome c)